VITTIVAVGTAGVVAVVTFLASRGVIKLNGLVGLRTRGTMSSQEAWVKGHTSALSVTVLTFCVVTVAAVAILFLVSEENRESFGLVATGLTVFGAVAAAIRAHRAARSELD